jgi:glucoamylase
MISSNILTFALLVPAAVSSVVHPSRRQSTLSAFIESENAVALKGVLNNIGPNGSGASGASAGIVVASPSRSNPDCTCFTHTPPKQQPNTAQTSTLGPVTLL